jgi:hypothetical protein
MAQAAGQGSFGIKPSSTWKVDKLVVVISRKYDRSNGDESYTLAVKGDTTINSLTYFKLYKTGILYLDMPVSYTDVYCGAVREDGAKVYYLGKSGTMEELLYDYSLKVGDIVKGRIAKGTKVIQIDTMNDGRKRFYLTKSMLHAMDATIIEGIGSFGGLLSDPPVGHYMSNDSYLVCYKENNQEILTGVDYFETGCDGRLSRFPINPDATWNVDYVSSCEPETIKEGDDLFNYHIVGDTSINDQRYYKIYKSGMAYYDTFFYYNDVYAGALRDDDNKFYYVHKGKSAEEMLYDFDLAVGDTIKTNKGKGFPIIKIDTLPDGRRRLLYMAEVCAGCCPMDEFIEGIGHWGGIMEEAPCLHPCFRSNYLLCYKENGVTVYSNNFSGMFAKGCDANPVPVIHENALNIYPLPAGDILTIESEGPALSDAQVNVYTIDGRMILLQHTRSAGQRITLDVSMLNKGFYLLKINGNKISITKKIIKN